MFPPAGINTTMDTWHRLSLSLDLTCNQCKLGKLLQNLRDRGEQHVFHKLKPTALSWLREHQGRGHLPLQSQRNSEQR